MSLSSWMKSETGGCQALSAFLFKKRPKADAAVTSGKRTDPFSAGGLGEYERSV